MDDGAKHRLVGALVIVALAVIFLPMILEGPRDSGEPATAWRVPPPPALNGPDREPLELPLPARQENSGEPVPPLPTAGPETTGSDAETKPEPEPGAGAPVEDTVLSGWVVQVASLGNKPNAYVLRDRLRGLGFTSFVEPVNTEKGELYRVRIGPEIQRENAEKLLEKLRQATEFQGMVTHYP